MTDVLNHGHNLGPLNDSIEAARRVAEGTPGAHEHRIEQVRGDTIERITAAGDLPKITIAKEFHPEDDKVRVNAQTVEKDEDGGQRHVTAKVFSTVYPDGANLVNGNVEIHRRMPDGTEKVRTKTKSPKLAQAVGSVIADQLIDKIKNQ